MHNREDMLMNEKVPDIVFDSVVGGHRERIKLSSYRGKYLLLFFYPANFSFASPQEICLPSGLSEELRLLNSHLIGISTEHVECLSKYQDSLIGPKEVRIVSDPFFQIFETFGILENDRKKNGFRALAIIDPKGRMLSIEKNYGQFGFDMNDVWEKFKESLKCQECGGKIVEEVIQGEKTRQYCEDCQLLRI